ncbi:hypothetical protein BDR07DRAFT_309569 [Suillus spraguei]|nr:hypothetical protein BDR07DRAFT_309569 [Suillus spraguei]
MSHLILTRKMAPSTNASMAPIGHRPTKAWTTFLELPVDSDALYLFTRGSKQSGHVDIVQSTQPTDKVGVQVWVGYNIEQALDNASVCHLERKANENGIGILTPAFVYPDQLIFEVKIIREKWRCSAHQIIRDTETSNYDQDVADIWNTTSFDRMSLGTSFGSVNAKSVTAEDGSIRSRNGAIKEHFNSASSLKLKNLNAPIQVSVSLLNREDGSVSDLKLTTSNGYMTSVLFRFHHLTFRFGMIDAHVDLVTHSGRGGIFDVATRNPHGPTHAC